MSQSGFRPRARSQFLISLQKELTFDRVYGGNTLISQATLSQGRVQPPLTRNKAIYTNMQELICSAKSEVLMMFYKIEHGSDPERDIDAALQELSRTARKQKRTIRVRLLMNNRGSLVQLVKPIQTVNIFSQGKTYPGLDFQYAIHTHQAFGSYHGKVIVVDGQRALLNSGDPTSNGNYEASSTPAKFIELSTRLEGGITKAIRSELAHLWNAKSVTVPRGKKASIPLCSPHSMMSESKEVEEDILFIAKRPVGNYFNRSFQSPHVTAVIRAIQHADAQINICNMSMNNDAILEAIADAYLRGVKIKIVLSQFGGYSSALLNMGGWHPEALQRLFTLLANRGVRNYDDIQIRWIANSGNIVNRDDTGAIHAKLICADDIVITGSSPMDLQSAYYSQETDVVIDSNLVADKYNQTVFQPLFDKGVDIFRDPGTHVIKPGLSAEMLLMREVFTLIENSIQKLETHKSNVAIERPGTQELATIDVALGKMKTLKQNISTLSHTKKSLTRKDVGKSMQDFKDICEEGAAECKRLEYHNTQSLFDSILQQVKNWFKNKFTKNKTSYCTLFAIKKIATICADKVEKNLRI